MKKDSQQDASQYNHVRRGFGILEYTECSDDGNDSRGIGSSRDKHPDYSGCGKTHTCGIYSF